MSKKLAALLLATLMLFTILAAACERAVQEPSASLTQDPSDTATPAPEETEDPIPAAEKVYRTSLSADIATLNAHNNTNTNVQTVYDYCSSPLYRQVPTEDGTAAIYVGDLADGEPYLTDEAGYVWNIKIREDAKWSNGDPINADTFIYSYKMLLDPKLVNSMANFAYSNYITIKNAEAYYKQLQEGNSAVAWDDVGIKKIDEYTLEFTTTQRSTASDVMRHFSDRSMFPVYEPLYEAGMNADRTATTYGTTLDEWMGCGPYILETWTNGAIHVYVKDPTHWMADYFKIDRVEIRITSDNNAKIQMWENGELDTLGLDATTLAIYKDDPRVYSYLDISITHIEINSVNTDNPILGTQAFRSALYYAVDRETLASLVGGVPMGVYVNAQAGAYPELGITYRETARAKELEPENYGYNPELALEYFNQAMTEIGESKVSVELLYNEASSGQKLMSEYLEQSLPKVFGEDRFTLTLRAVPSASLSAAKDWRSDPTCYDLGWSSWAPAISRVYPFMAFRYFTASYANHPNPYISADFDALYNACNTETVKMNADLMVEMTAELERVYLRDVVNVPVYEPVNYVMYSEKLILPCTEYVPGIGYGVMFADVAD